MRSHRLRPNRRGSRPSRWLRPLAPAVLAVVVAGSAVGLAGCGVPLDEEPRPVTGATLPAETTPTTSDSPTAQEVSVYFLVDDHLEVALRNTGTTDLSIAKMKSPQGWEEPGQQPAFDEYTIVLKGTLVVETEHQGKIEVKAGQAIITHKGEWIRYGSPYEGGAEYIAVCLPVFALDTVHRDPTP